MCFGIDVTIAIFGSRSIGCPSFVQVCVGLCSLKLQVLDDQPGQQRGAGYIGLEGGYGEGPQLGIRLAIEAAALVTVCVYVILAAVLGYYCAVIVVAHYAAPRFGGVRSAAVKIHSIWGHCVRVCRFVAD